MFEILHFYPISESIEIQENAFDKIFSKFNLVYIHVCLKVL